MRTKKILVVTDTIMRHTGAGSNFQGEARIGGNVNQVEVIQIDKLLRENYMRGRQYDLIILPKEAEGNEKISSIAYAAGNGEGQVMYL